MEVVPMGGCYTNYGSSPCSRSYEKEWKTLLNRALRKPFDLKTFTQSYAQFLQDQEAGFIKEIALHQGIKEIAQIPNEFPGIEYEVKFALAMGKGKGDEPEITDFLDAFDFPATRNARFVKDPVHANATGINRFFGLDGDERLVVIEKCGGLYLKEKSGALEHNYSIPFEQIVLKRTEDRYAATLDKVIAKTHEVLVQGSVCYGHIRKEKADDFLLDTSSGRIFSFTITRSHLQKTGAKDESDIQRQLEIEYAGYLPGFPDFAQKSEKQMIQNMVDVARTTFALYQHAILPRGWSFAMEVTDERKYDFVSGNGRRSLNKQDQLLLVMPGAKKELVQP